MKDWLFQVPDSGGGGLEAQEEIIAGWLRDDPEAAAISDAEAETFFAVAWGVRFLAPSMLRLLARAFGVRIHHSGAKADKYLITQILQRYSHPKCKELLLYLLPNLMLGCLPDVTGGGHRVTSADLIEAYHKRMNIAWLVYYIRMLGRDDQVGAFLQAVDGEREYRFWLNIARLTQRRVVPPAAPPGESDPDTEAMPVLDFRMLRH